MSWWERLRVNAKEYELRKDEFMKKWERRYIVITAIIFAVACIATIVFEYICVEKVEIIRTLLTSIFLLIAIAMIVYLFIGGIFAMKQGIHHIKKCDDELFGKIDQYKRCWGENQHYYIKQIQIINLYYGEGGKVDELVKNKEIERLYARADFLLIQNSLFDNLITCFYSLVISVVASFVCQMMESESVLLMFVWMVIILLSFFGIILSRYAEKGQAGSYRYYIDEYERGLLLQKITDLEKKLTITADDEQILETKQVVINELIRMRQKNKLKKQKEKLESDIKQVGQLDLCLGDYSKCYIQKIYVNGTTACLVYDREKGKENNYIGELNLMNQEYAILYRIMNSYELISYSE
jgi:hypothetical protein